MNYYIYILALVGLVLSFLIGWFLRKQISKKTISSAESKAKNILTKAKVKQQEIFFNAREEALKVAEKGKKEEAQRRKELKVLENRLEQRRELFEKKILELDKKQNKISIDLEKIEGAKDKVRELYSQAKIKLEEIAGLKKDEARDFLFEKIEKEFNDDILLRIKKLKEEGSAEIEKQVKQLMVNVMERMDLSHFSERSASTVLLPSDEMKGRIIGREGRNIKVIEQLTGVEVIVDDTPEAIIISSFNPIRRQLAKRSIEKLVLDGRIQPARIESVIGQVKKELAKEIKKAGEDAVQETGVAGLNAKIIQALGRLKYRTSYGQNVLLHSIEVANLSEMLAIELGADVAVAKKAGLIHDIGKAIDFEIQGTHTELGKNLAEKYNIQEKIIIAAMEHHDDHPSTLEGVIVKVADAISGSRPGARRDSYEKYVKRLKELEELAKVFSGVKKSYAIQAGRELRVFVQPEEIDDLTANKLAQKISKRIEEELKYPGEIKVTVIRESRVIEYAR